jgi:hypothetical protein
MHNEEPPGFRHAGAGRHPDPSSTWIPFFNGMTDSVCHLDSRVRGNDASSRPPIEGIPAIFKLCKRAQAHGHFVVNYAPDKLPTREILH